MRETGSQEKIEIDRFLVSCEPTHHIAHQVHLEVHVSELAVEPGYSIFLKEIRLSLFGYHRMIGHLIEHVVESKRIRMSAQLSGPHLKTECPQWRKPFTY